MQTRLERLRRGAPPELALDLVAGREEDETEPLVGREEPLARVLALLAPERARPERRIVTVHGARGSGTSTLVNAVAHHAATQYRGGVFVVDASLASWTQPPLELVAWARANDVPGLAARARACCRAHLALHVLHQRRALLVLDGAPSWVAARDWLPRADGACDVLVASSGAQWPEAWNPVLLEPLGPEPAGALVRAHWPTAADAEVDAVVTAAAGNVRVLVTRATARVAEADPATRAPLTVPADAAALLPAVHALAAQHGGDDARVVLDALAIAADRAVPLDELDGWLAPLGWDEARRDHALTLALRTRLLAADRRLRLAQQVAQVLPFTPAGPEAERGVAAVRAHQRSRLFEAARSLADDQDALDDDLARARFARLAGRSSSWALPTPEALRRADEVPSLAQAADVARVLLRVGHEREAHRWAARALLLHRVPGDAADRDLRAELHLLQGRVLRDRGDAGPAAAACCAAADEAPTALRRAESLREAGLCQAASGDPHGGRILVEQALEVHVGREASGARRTDEELVAHAEAAFALGWCLESEGELEAARAAYTASIERFDGPMRRLGAPGERVFDPERRGVARFRLATLEQREGLHERAIALFEAAAADEELGDRDGVADHLDVGRTLYERAWSLEALGRLDEAQVAYQQAYDVEAYGDGHGRQDHESRGGTLHALARVLGRRGDARIAAQTYLRAAEERRRGNVHGVVDHESVGASLHMAGLVLRRAGEPRAARGHFEAALEEARRGNGTGTGPDHEGLGRTLHEIGHCLYAEGRVVEARHWYELAIEAKGKGDARGVVDHESLGLAHEMRGACLSAEGDLAGAREAFTTAAAEAERGDARGVVDLDSVRNHHHRLGVVCVRAGDHEAGRAALQRAIELGLRLRARDVDFDRRDLAASYVDLGASHVLEGDEAAGEAAFEQAVEVCRGPRLDGYDDGGAWWAMHGVGLALIRVRRLARALEWFERAAVQAQYDDDVVDHERVSKSLHEGGWCLAEEGDTARALGWFERALEASRAGDRDGAVDHSSVGTTLHEIGWCLAEEERTDEARARFEEAVEEKLRGRPDGSVDHDGVGRSLNELGWCLGQEERYPEAREAYQRALDQFELAAGQGNANPEGEAAALRAIGRCTLLLGDARGARPWFERAVAKFSFGDARGIVDHNRVGSCLRLVGECYEDVERHTRARSWFERAVQSFEKAQSEGRVDRRGYRLALERVADALEREGRYSEAQEYNERAEAWRPEDGEDDDEL